jgi:bisanhydrobacterioruberin hydratase
MNLTEISGTMVAVGSAVAIGLFALPSYVSTLRQKGLGKGVVILVALGIFALIFETIAIKTGLPYGRFSYGDGLGSKFINTTPWTVMLAYPPIILGAYWLARKFGRPLAIFLTPVFATIVDFVLDPAMVKLEFWKWEVAGPYFGVPIINFVGWLISGFIAALILSALWGDTPIKRGAAYSVFGILLFWTGVNIGVGQRIPAIIGVITSSILLILFIIEKRRDKSINE